MFAPTQQGGGCLDFTLSLFFVPPLFLSRTHHCSHHAAKRVRALTAERAARATGEMPSDVDAKRQAAIDKKEVERKAKNEEIKAKKAEMQGQRDKAKASGDEEAAAAKKKQDEVNAKREANIKDRESKRNQNQKSKYSKSDVMLLKNIFGVRAAPDVAHVLSVAVAGALATCRPASTTAGRHGVHKFVWRGAGAV